MSARTASRRVSKGIVAETLGRPIREAVREGVREAMADQQAREREHSEDDGGRRWGRMLLVALVGLGAAAFAMRRWRSGGSGGGHDRRTSEIRERGKASEEPTGPDVSTQGGVDAVGESADDEDAAESATPGTRGEDD